MTDGASEANPFRDLIPCKICIQAKPGCLSELIAAMDAALNSGWQRDREQEEKCAPSLRPFVTCYRCDARDGREAAKLALHQVRDDFLCDTHLEFAGRRELGTDWSLTTAEIDRILFDFRDNVLSKLPPDSFIRFAIGVVNQ